MWDEIGTFIKSLLSPQQSPVAPMPLRADPGAGPVTPLPPFKTHIEPAGDPMSALPASPAPSMSAPSSLGPPPPDYWGTVGQSIMSGGRLFPSLLGAAMVGPGLERQYESQRAALPLEASAMHAMNPAISEQQWQGLLATDPTLMQNILPEQLKPQPKIFDKDRGLLIDRSGTVTNLGLPESPQLAMKRKTLEANQRLAELKVRLAQNLQSAKLALMSAQTASARQSAQVKMQQIQQTAMMMPFIKKLLDSGNFTAAGALTGAMGGGAAPEASGAPSSEGDSIGYLPSDASPAENFDDSTSVGLK